MNEIKSLKNSVAALNATAGGLRSQLTRERRAIDRQLHTITLKEHALEERQRKFDRACAALAELVDAMENLQRQFNHLKNVTANLVEALREVGSFTLANRIATALREVVDRFFGLNGQ